MFNPFRTIADARRASRILGDLGTIGAHCDTLTEQAEVAVALLEGLRREKLHLSIKLAAANAKIARMTSGLKRGAKKTA